MSLGGCLSCCWGKNEKLQKSGHEKWLGENTISYILQNQNKIMKDSTVQKK